MRNKENKTPGGVYEPYASFHEMTRPFPINNPKRDNFYSSEKSKMIYCATTCAFKATIVSGEEQI